MKSKKTKQAEALSQIDNEMTGVLTVLSEIDRALGRISRARSLDALYKQYERDAQILRTALRALKDQRGTYRHGLCLKD